MVDVDFRTIQFGSDEYLKTLKLRELILRAPLGLQFKSQELEKDIHDIHLGAFSKDRLVACLILSRVSQPLMKMRQVAVAESIQGRGIGRGLVEFAERKVLEEQAFEIELSARENAVPFYLKLGYKTEGEAYSTLNIPHVKMFKSLKVIVGH